MSSEAAKPRGAGLRVELIAGAVFVALGLLLLLIFASQRQQALRASPTGLDGLQVWLRAGGEDVQSFTGGWGIHSASIGLLVIPVYDSDLAGPRTPPRTKEELLLQQDEYDLALRNIARKRSELPTLLVMPKWRSAVRLSGLAHPFLAVERQRIRTTLQRTTHQRGQEVVRSHRPFTDFVYDASDGSRLTARLYSAQMFRGQGCTPVIGRDDAMILAECRSGESRPFFVLSDPDLLNNHGLRLGDNARIARDFFRDLADGQRILIDYSPGYWFVEDSQGQRPERTWADLLQFFAYPFLLLWAGTAVLMLLAVWRGGSRFGAARAERPGPGHAKMQAVSARARLMRLTRQDGALLADYASARLAAVAAELLGPAYGRDEAGALRHFARLNPERTERLKDLLAQFRAMPAHPAATDAIAAVDAFETILSEFEHDP